MGIPVTGPTAISGAAVLAGQGQLNIAAVLIVTAAGNEAGGLLSYQNRRQMGPAAPGTSEGPA